jgi:hypothetical protein
MNITPNPFTDILIVDLIEADNFPVDLIILDTNEKEVYRNRIFTTKKIIDVSNVKEGTYRITMLDDGKLLYEGIFSKIG